MDLLPTPLPGLRLLRPRRHGDDRGWFSETYNARDFAELGITSVFVQDNQSFSAEAGTVRGLHFQTPPQTQAKLVRCPAGAILDVAVDIRRGSPTFGHHFAVELSAENGLQLFLPPGFAHGLCTLAADTTVMYKVDAFYSPAHDTGFQWNDPDIAIPWPITADRAVLSPKDARLPRFREIETPFTYADG